MSKAHMVVLSFLKAKPFHGYQMGQLVEQLKLPSWTGVTLPAIYKAMKNLEKSKHIRGEEMREGNNPPRMVYHLNNKGKDYLRQIMPNLWLIARVGQFHQHLRHITQFVP